MTEEADLDAFFKSKTKAGKKKKTHIQNVDVLGKKLARTSKMQEEIDREEEERQRQQDQQQIKEVFQKDHPSK